MLYSVHNEIRLWWTKIVVRLSFEMSVTLPRVSDIMMLIHVAMCGLWITGIYKLLYSLDSKPRGLLSKIGLIIGLVHWKYFTYRGRAFKTYLQEGTYYSDLQYKGPPS